MACTPANTLVQADTRHNSKTQNELPAARVHPVSCHVVFTRVRRVPWGLQSCDTQETLAAIPVFAWPRSAWVRTKVRFPPQQVEDLLLYSQPVVARIASGVHESARVTG